MRFERMRPDQVAAAVAAGLPFVLPVGVLPVGVLPIGVLPVGVLPIGVMEYHGQHLPAGVDLLAVTEVLARLGDRIVVLPPLFAYGAASHAVAGPVGTGTLHVDATALLPFAEGLFAALLRAGLTNIHGVIHHQTEGFDQGMPTDLAFRLAARNAILRHLETTHGPGWWGDRAMQDYYARQAQGDDPFNWIRIHPLFPKGAAFPFDHAGIGETALMQALAPGTVALERAGIGDHWYTETAPQATAAMGEAGVALALAHLERCLGIGV